MAFSFYYFSQLPREAVQTLSPFQAWRKAQKTDSAEADVTPDLPFTLEGEEHQWGAAFFTKMFCTIYVLILVLRNLNKAFHVPVSPHVTHRSKAVLAVVAYFESQHSRERNRPISVEFEAGHIYMVFFQTSHSRVRLSLKKRKNKKQIYKGQKYSSAVKRT